MKASALKYAVVSGVATIVTLILAFIPFHAFLTVWASDLFGHYTAFRLWKEVLLAGAIIGSLYLVLTDHKIRTHALSRRLVWLITAYGLLLGLVGALAYVNGDVTPKALAYGWLVDLRYLAFFMIAWAVALRTSRLEANWFRLLMVPAMIVVGFGLLQATVLPDDFLKNFGYSAATIEPVETVDQNQDYVRIFSTLRGPNPLGAYLILPITVLVLMLVTKKRRVRVWIALAATLAVLFFSHSRSAYIGTAVSVLVLLGLQLRSPNARRYLAVSVAALVVIGAGLAIALQRNTTFQNIVLHTQDGSTSSVTSNEARLAAQGNGLVDIIKTPLGGGPGTAGPASVYNDGKADIAENYFIQIGQEAGVLGLGLFLLINGGIAYLLWLRRRSPLAVSLLASLIGLSVVNLLQHAWADDTLAYVWWGLAGVAMAVLPIQDTVVSTDEAKK